MNRSIVSRCFSASATCLVALASSLGLTHPLACADQPVSIVRVEEDWELTLGQPDTNSNGPQVSCTFSPYSDLSSLYAVIELNHRSVPEFTSGGLQLQVWNGEAPVASNKFPRDDVFQTSGETVSWTQTMKIANANLTFEIVNGSSTTWGSFGGQGYMRYVTDTSLENLNSYNPDVSVTNSGAGYAGNRVQLLVLRRVRYELSTGQTIEDSTVRVAHSSN